VPHSRGSVQARRHSDAKYGTTFVAIHHIMKNVINIIARRSPADAQLSRAISAHCIGRSPQVRGTIDRRARRPKTSEIPRENRDQVEEEHPAAGIKRIKLPPRFLAWLQRVRVRRNASEGARLNSETNGSRMAMPARMRRFQY